MPQELGTPVYIDSSSTTFVATNRAAPKKSTWVRRKSEELNECHELGESLPIKIGLSSRARRRSSWLTSRRRSEEKGNAPAKATGGAIAEKPLSYAGRHAAPARS